MNPTRTIHCRPAAIEQGKRRAGCSCRLSPRRLASRHGFTLVEVVLAMTLLVTVLAVSYNVIVDCLETDRQIDKVALPEKVGEGVMMLFRRDLAGVYFRQLGRRIFFISDGGSPPNSRDEMRLITTVPPTPIEELEGGANTVYQSRSLTGVHYFLRDNPDVQDVRAMTLFRKEITTFDPIAPLDAPGAAYEVYDKVAYLNIEAFDGFLWTPEWDSEVQIAVEEEELAFYQEQQQGQIARVSAAQAPVETINAAPGVAPTATTDQISLPSAVPSAVRVEFGVYVGRGNTVEFDSNGEPILKVYSATVPIITARRMFISGGEDSGMGDGGSGSGVESFNRTGGDAGAAPGGNAPTGGLPGGRSFRPGG